MCFKYVLSIGSNIEPKLDNLIRALKELSAYGEIIERSSIYKTEPWGKKDQSDFFNAAIKFNSRRAPLDLMTIIKNIEKKMGRKKTHRWGERIIDIDILFADDLVIDEVDLKIPHRLMAERKFVLAPLAELTEDFHLPHFLKTANEILHECSDSAIVEKLPLDWE